MILMPLFTGNANDADSYSVFGFKVSFYTLLLFGLLMIPICNVIYPILKTKKTWKMKPQRTYSQPKPNCCIRCFNGLNFCKNKKLEPPIESDDHETKPKQRHIKQSKTLTFSVDDNIYEDEVGER